MAIKKYRPYLTASQIRLILNRLDTSYPDEKELYDMLSVTAFKVGSAILKPATSTESIEEKLGFQELSSDKEAELFAFITGTSKTESSPS